MNRTDEFAIQCFVHWVEIAESMNAKVIVVCDQEDLAQKILEIRKDFFIIPSYREQAKVILDALQITNTKWVNIGSALLTPFFHSREHAIQNFWNIDADDLYLLYNATSCAKALSQAKQYAENNEIDLFALDIHYTCFHLYKILGSFGVVYTRNTIDLLFVLRENLQGILNAKMRTWNIDAVYSVLHTHLHILKMIPFYIENMYLSHTPVITSWHNDVLHFKNEPFGYWRICQIQKLQGIPIPPENVKIDVDISENTCKEFVQKHFRDIDNEIKIFEQQKIFSFLYNEDILKKCAIFEIYISFLLNLRHKLTIFIASNYSYTPPHGINPKLKIMSMFGILLNLEKTYGYSFLSIIDNGEAVQECWAKTTEVSVLYNFNSHNAHIISQGYFSSHRSHQYCSIKIDNIEYAVNKRGLNFVVFDKTANKVIDSVCFDTWDNWHFYRNDI